ncbi:MAG: hypothetical protein IPK58_15115 [Acidobacteria bacterium]|nr:hypothetical protein [Acidobacteriota bacterium]
MKKSIQLVLSIAIAAVVAFGQNGPLPFDNSVFDSNFETAKWLAEYDEVAWKTSDVVMAQDKKELARLGTAWFCFKDSKDAWHAVYGKFENSQFELVFHFTMDAKKVVTRSEEKPDSGMLGLYAKALGLGQAKVKERVGANAPAFNQYIRRNSDQTFTVWLFPAFQTNGLAVYGGEGIFTIDSKAEKITKDESYYQPGFRGIPDRQSARDLAQLPRIEGADARGDILCLVLSRVFHEHQYRQCRKYEYADQVREQPPLGSCGEGQEVSRTRVLVFCVVDSKTDRFRSILTESTQSQIPERNFLDRLF